MILGMRLLKNDQSGKVPYSRGFHDRSPFDALLLGRSWLTWACPAVFSL